MTQKKHLKYMLITGLAVIGVPWVSGVSLGAALPYAFLLACPLMMIVMMTAMNHGGNTQQPTDTSVHGDQGDEHSAPPVPAATRTEAEPAKAQQIGQIDREYRL